VAEMIASRFAAGGHHSLIANRFKYPQIKCNAGGELKIRSGMQNTNLVIQYTAKGRDAWVFSSGV